jgi:chloride channel protein, CIC family
VKGLELEHPQYDHTDVPPTLTSQKALAFWVSVLVTGVGAGVAAGVLTRLLEMIEGLMWPGTSILAAGAHAGYARRMSVLLGAGVLTGIGQLVLQHVSSANGIDIVEAITRFAGRLPVIRTLGSALLSIVVVGMGASLGREGAPKQVGAVIASVLSERAGLSDEQRRLLFACGAGAGMAAAYGVPLGGAIFSLEVLRGVLALRLILPALLASATATALSWLILPNAPTYVIPAYPLSASVVCWALVAGPIIGLVSIAYVRLVALADRSRPQGWLRLIAPTIALGLLGALSVRFPQLLGNGKDVTQLAFTDQVAPLLMLVLVFLRPARIIMCIGSGVPGGLFTPSLALGALLGGVLGFAWSCHWPGVPQGLFAVLGAGAVLAATTHGPISAVVLIMELTARDRSFMLPLLVVIVTATVISRTLDARSIYDARFSDKELKEIPHQGPRRERS